MDTPQKSGIIFTYKEDHTFVITFAGKKRLQGFAMLGSWKLEGNVLVTVIASGTNTYAAQEPAIFPANTERVIVTKLNDSVMTWRGSRLGFGTTLRRVTDSTQ